ncbi:MAG: YdeI/OmpD-associated family protein [Defluviitaleaceae bacterium]|nr:YdeI/OmpD-associated family protein [Defluviitaleaceae bacterium]
MPDELTSALKDEGEAAAFWESLSDGYKRGYCDWVGGAKQKTTREVRAGKALVMLKNKQKTLKTWLINPENY